MTRLKRTVCPWCGHRHELVSAIAAKGTITEPTAEDGDVTLCIGCGELSIFDQSATGGIRFATETENRELAGMALVNKLRMAYREAPQKFTRPILHIPPWMKRST